MENRTYAPVVRFASLLAIIGLIYGLVVDILSAVQVEIFLNLIAGRINLFLSFFSAAAILFFFVSFCAGYLETGINRLKMATLFVIGGSGLMLLLHFKGFAIFFRIYSLSSVFRFPYLESFIPWFNSLLLLIFFTTFHLEMALQKRIVLERATICGIISAAIALLLRSVLLFLFVTTGAFQWFSELPQPIRLILLPLSIMGYGLMLCFFIIFRRHLSGVPDET